MPNLNIAFKNCYILRRGDIPQCTVGITLLRATHTLAQPLTRYHAETTWCSNTGFVILALWCVVLALWCVVWFRYFGAMVRCLVLNDNDTSYLTARQSFFCQHVVQSVPMVFSKHHADDKDNSISTYGRTYLLRIIMTGYLYRHDLYKILAN